MKKLLVILAACLLVFGVAGQARAYFQTGELIRAVFATNGSYELLSDLGSVSSWNMPAAGVTSGSLNIYTPGDTTGFSGSTPISSLDVVYFTLGSTGSQFWGSYTQGGSVTGVAAQFTNLKTGINDLFSQISGPVADVGQNPANVAFSYYNNIGSGGANNFAKYFPDSNSAIPLVAGSVVDQSLLYFATAKTTGSTGSTTYATDLFTSIDASGNMVTHESPVPIPPSVLLLGSGLLGLVGIRRKNIFNS